ncbi:DUF115 domain-containing protein [bacterium]|nr:DUF115 domain-containing protein [bacterium]
MDYYHDNCLLLAKKEPLLVEKLKDVPVEDSCQEIKGIVSFGSKEIKEADLLVILGWGMGLCLESILKLCSPKTFILVIEESLSRFKDVLSKRDLSVIIECERISISVNESPFIATLLRLERYFSVLTFKEMYVIEHLPSIKENPKYYQEVEAKLKEALYMATVNVGTFLRYGAIWKNHILTNFPLILKHPGVNCLNHKFKELPVIIVGAGPSLDRNITTLKEVKDTALIISTDTALTTMLKNKVLPHLVMTVDGTIKNFTKCYQNLDIPKNIFLISDLMAYPETFSKFSSEKIFILNDGHPLLQWLGRFAGFDSYIPRGGNVSTAAFNLALRLGSKTIILIGQDLSFPGGKFYSQGIVKKTSRYLKNNLDSSQLMEIQDIFGHKLTTSRTLYGFIKWFENRIDHLDIDGINATEGGANIQGFKNLSLKEAIKDYCLKPFPIYETLQSLSSNFQKPVISPLLEKINQLSEEYQMVNILCDQALNIIKRFLFDSLNSSYFNNLLWRLNDLKKEIVSLENFIFCERFQMEPLIHQLSNQEEDIPFLEKVKTIKTIFFRLQYISKHTLFLLEDLKMAFQGTI